ncbi:hypothetical protein L211DRAFT_838570, partial [Terfezia boudieri ATCC MYA-4762]
MKMLSSIIAILVSTIIQAGIQSLQQPNTASEILPVDEPVPRKIPTVSDAISQLDDLLRHFPLFLAPNSSFRPWLRQFFRHENTIKVQKQLQDFWPS